MAKAFTKESGSIQHKHHRRNDSAESLTKEFYSKILRWYTWAQNPSFHVTFPGCSDRKLDEHLIRLITRVIFVWFIKQKGLCADALFDVREVGRLLEKFDPTAGKMPEDCICQREETTNYYRAILQNFFFAAINQPIKARRFVCEHDDKQRTHEHDSRRLYRYGALFTESGKHEIQKLFAKTPYLNIGMFDCLDRFEQLPDGEIRFVYEDGFSQNDERVNGVCLHRAFVPNVLFFSEDIECPGLITILKQYRFRAEEGVSDDASDALDPEILGHVFENLLACINPETRESARQMTGAFYTPREIVRCMVNASIAEYLKKKFSKADGAHINRLIEGEDCPSELESLRGDLCRALLKVRILDPACGSGAFPIGAVQCLIELLHKLGHGIGNDYSDKKKIIENCLYGIDIQPIAVQITKLRCIISLLSEEKPDFSKSNLGIKPLPNLDNHFAAANALIPFEIKWNQNEKAVKREFKRYHESRQNLKTRAEGAQLPSCRERAECGGSLYIRRERALLEELIRTLEQCGTVSKESIVHLSEWEPYVQTKAAMFFDSALMFGRHKGFDIVIGNPPYGAAMSSEEKAIYKRTYAWLNKKYDIYMVFFELGLRLSSHILCYITPDKWLSKSFGLEFRKNAMVSNMIQVLHLGHGVFDAALVDAIITIFTKSGSKELTLLKAESEREFKAVNRIDKTQLEMPYLIDQYFQSEPPKVIGQLEQLNHRLGEYAKCEYVSVNPNDAYRLKTYIKSNPNPCEKELKIINTGLIGQYMNRWNNKEMTYLKSKYKNPVIDICDISELYGESFVRRATSPKLIIKGLNLLNCAVDLKGRFMSTVATLNIRSESTDLLCVLACIINSSIASEYIKSKYMSSSYCGGLLFTPDMINHLPVPDLSSLDDWRDVIELAKAVTDGMGGKAMIEKIDSLVKQKLIEENG